MEVSSFNAPLESTSEAWSEGGVRVLLTTFFGPVEDTAARVLYDPNAPTSPRAPLYAAGVGAMGGGVDHNSLASSGSEGSEGGREPVMSPNILRMLGDDLHENPPARALNGREVESGLVDVMNMGTMSSRFKVCSCIFVLMFIIALVVGVTLVSLKVSKR